MQNVTWSRFVCRNDSTESFDEKKRRESGRISRNGGGGEGKCVVRCKRRALLDADESKRGTKPRSGYGDRELKR